jgi:hypothetical protein
MTDQGEAMLDQIVGTPDSDMIDTVGNTAPDFNNESGNLNTSDVDLTSGGADEGDMNDNRS